MIAITRTHRQWLATTRNLARASGHRELIAGIVDAIGVEMATDHPDTYLAVVLTPAQSDELEAAAPMSAWWMPGTPGWLLLMDEAKRTADAADAFLRSRHRSSFLPAA